MNEMGVSTNSAFNVIECNAVQTEKSVMSQTNRTAVDFNSHLSKETKTS
jgi:hypothetical protein